MATALSTLVDRTRNFLRDTPDYDQLSTSLNASSTTIPVADASLYAARWPIEVDYETIMLRGSGAQAGTSLSGTRGWRGSTAASHASSASIFIRPAFYSSEIIGAINGAIQAMFPWVYQPVVDTSLTVLANQYQYVIPNMPNTTYPMPYVTDVEILQPGDYTFRRARRWEVERGNVTSGSPATSNTVSSTFPVIKFRSLPPVSGVIRVKGFGPFPTLTNLTDTLDPLFPPQAEQVIHKIAAGYLLQSGESGRDRADAGPVDRREEANRGGLSLQTGMSILQRSDLEVLRGAMPPLPRHVKAVW